MKSTKKRLLKLVYVVLSLLVLGILFFIFNKQIQVWIDRVSINKIKSEVHNNFNPGSADSLRQFLDTFDLAASTQPIFTDSIKFRKRTHWSLNKHFNNKLIEETIIFPSCLRNLNPIDSAYFYSYRQTGYTNSKIILWVPGLGVSDFAFNFIKHFFIKEIERGYTIVVYVPPFHMKRTMPGKKNGEGFLGANIKNDLLIQLEAIRELRTILTFLQQQKPEEISAWGGSMGASFLLLSTQFYTYKHISLMIPVIDWEYILLQNKDLKSLQSVYAHAGIDSVLLSKAFKVISPVNYKLNIPMDKTLIQLADYDQLTPKNKIEKFASHYGIKNVKSYHRSHATILISRQLYIDYGNFLDSLQ